MKCRQRFRQSFINPVVAMVGCLAVSSGKRFRWRMSSLVGTRNRGDTTSSLTIKRNFRTSDWVITPTLWATV